jgi:hypothetical protein
MLMIGWGGRLDVRALHAYEPPRHPFLFLRFLFRARFCSSGIFCGALAPLTCLASLPS